MMIRPMTYGELGDLLVELGFALRVLDDHNVVYREIDGDWLFILPNRPPNTPAEEWHVSLVRRQLDMRGLMEKADFDAHFNQPRTAAER